MATSLQKRQVLTFAVAWIAYASTYLLRKPIGVIKSDLIHEPMSLSKTQLGILDTMLLLPYAMGQMFLGFIGDRYGTRRTFAACLALSSLSMVTFGLWDAFYMFSALLFLNGLSQALCWPNATKSVGSWYPDNSRNIVMGLYGTCAYAGGILATLLAVQIQDVFGWRYVHLIPSGVMIVLSLMVFLLLYSPGELGVLVPGKESNPGRTPTDAVKAVCADEVITLVEKPSLIADKPSLIADKPSLIDDKPTVVISNGSPTNACNGDKTSESLPDDDSDQLEGNSSIKEAAPRSTWIELWKIPVVPDVAIAVMCLKVVRYCMYMWLPLYLKDFLNYSQMQAGNFSTMFEIGGVIGTIALGFVIDKFMSGRNILGSTISALLSTFSLFLFYMTSDWGILMNSIFMFGTGAFNCGPDTILGGSVPMELGELDGRNDAAAVTGLINGFGTVGTIAEGPIVGLIAQHYGWGGVFYMMLAMSSLGTFFSLRATIVMARLKRSKLTIHVSP